MFNHAPYLRAGLTAHSQPRSAVPLMAAIIASQAAALGGAAWLRPYTSWFLNLLEVACGGLDIATLVLTLVAYTRKLLLTGEALPAQPDAFIKVGWCHTCP